MHVMTHASSPDGAAAHGHLALIAGSSENDRSLQRLRSDGEYFNELKAWRNDETIWWSAMEFLAKELDGSDEVDLTFCAVHVYDADHAAEFRSRMQNIVNSLGLDMGHNIVFGDGRSCSTDAIWTMPVVIAERLAALEGGWDAFDSRPIRETPVFQAPRTAMLFDASSGHVVPTPPWGWHRKRV